MLAGKITLAVLVIGLVAFMAVNTMNKPSFSRRWLVEESPQAEFLKELQEEGEEMGLEKPFPGLRGSDSVAETQGEVIPSEEKEDLSFSSGPEARVKGSRRFLWYYYPQPAPPPPMYPPPAPRYPPPAPRYPPPAPKYPPPAPKYPPPAPKYPPPAPRYPPPAPRYPPPAPKYPPPYPYYTYPRPAPAPVCPSGPGVAYYKCNYCYCWWYQRKFSIAGCGCGCMTNY